MSVSLPHRVISLYESFSLYNSPYKAHELGNAIDLYPYQDNAPSPVSGKIIENKILDAPNNPYNIEKEHFILIDTGDHIARIMHVNPHAKEGDTIKIGDSLGELQQSGYFAPWVSGHIHLEFRNHDDNPFRASGSYRIKPKIDIKPIEWNGEGTVIEKKETYAILDEPKNPYSEDQFVGISAGIDNAVLDGGLHYKTGGVINGSEGVYEIAGNRLGHYDGENIDWNNIKIYVNGEEIHGISFYITRGNIGIKLICPNSKLERGDSIKNIEIGK